jgi:hypothetical protein
MTEMLNVECWILDYLKILMYFRIYGINKITKVFTHVLSFHSTFKTQHSTFVV